MAWPEPTARGFYGRFRDPEGNKQYVLDGEGKPRRFAKKKDALGAARDEEAKIRQGTWWDPTHGAVTFADYFEKHWLPNKVVELNTTRKYDEQYDNRNWGPEGLLGRGGTARHHGHDGSDLGGEDGQGRRVPGDGGGPV